MSSFIYLGWLVGAFVIGYLLGGWRMRRVYEVRLEEAYDRGLSEGKDPEWLARKNL